MTTKTLVKKIIKETINHIKKGKIEKVYEGETTDYFIVFVVSEICNSLNIETPKVNVLLNEIIPNVRISI